MSKFHYIDLSCISCTISRTRTTSCAIFWHGKKLCICFGLFIDFYAFVNALAGGIMFLECSCVRAYIRPCASPEQTLLARYLGYLLKEFDQTFSTNGFWGKMNASNFGVKRLRVKVTVRSSS